MNVHAPEAPSAWRVLLRGPAVLRLTGSVAVSEIGSMVTFLALPLLALLQLGAGAGVVGLLTAAQFVPWVVLALPIGAAVDRWAPTRHRQALVACDLVRAVLLTALPVLYATGRLTVPLLLLVVLVVGATTVLAEITSGTVVPEVVDRGLLTHVNGSIEAARSLAMVVGPALAGVLVAGLGAAQALLADAASFVVSAVLLARLPVRNREAEPRPQARLAAMIREGVDVLRRDPVLGRLCLWSTTSNLTGNALTPVVLTFVVREAGMSPGLLGATLAVAAVGGVAGALASGPLALRVGHGRFVAASAVVLGAGILAVGAIGLVTPPRGLALAGWLAVAYAVTLAANVAGNAQLATIRQHLVPEGQLARVLAAWRTLGYAGIPVGAALGGVLGDAVGLRQVVVGSAVAFALTCVIPLARPVRQLRLAGA
jgi:MFS family permease